MRIVAGVEQGNSEWTETTVLSVALLKIAKTLGEELDWDVFVVAEQVLLCGGAGIVDQSCSVSSISCDSRDDITTRREPDITAK